MFVHCSWHAISQVGPRLARTEARSVDAAISQVLGMMLRAGYLRPGRSTHDPDLQFEAKVTRVLYRNTVEGFIVHMTQLNHFQC